MPARNKYVAVFVNGQVRNIYPNPDIDKKSKKDAFEKVKKIRAMLKVEGMHETFAHAAVVEEIYEEDL